MRVLDLFSGIGGFSLGLERAGMKTISFCEIDPFCRRVLAKHWPEVPILGDVSAADFPAADIIVGGFPCQDVSRAGKRAGVTGLRSGLYRQLVRAIRLVRPKYAILENVAALLGDGMGDVLGDLAESGCDAEWDCVPAEAIGAPHERDRVWIVAHATGGNDWQCHTSQAERQKPEFRDSACQKAFAHATSDRRGQGRSRRPPDSFAWIRDTTCRHATDALCAGPSQREGIEANPCTQLPTTERAAFVDVWQSQWPSEPALLGMDDGIADRVDRVRALGNSLVPQIPELIGRAIMAAEAEMNGHT